MGLDMTLEVTKADAQHLCCLLPGVEEPGQPSEVGSPAAALYSRRANRI
jgi:hypothetical protein